MSDTQHRRGGGVAATASARGGKDAGKDTLSIGLQARSRLLAVALDTNALGRGRPHLGNLTTLAARLQVIGLPVWVPEPVAWEWAQHIGEDWQAALGTTAPSWRQLADAGLTVTPPASPYTDQSAVQRAFLEALAKIDNLTVVPLSADSAKEGLKDQILQRPPGRRKDGVKTGAADSAWLRDLQRAAQGDLSRVLLVSADGDIKRACQEWQVPTPLMRGWGQLLETLFTFTLDDSDATVTRLIVAYLRRRLFEDPPGGCGFTVTADPRQLAALVEDSLDREPDRHLISAELTHLDHLAGVINVSVQAPESSPAVPPGNGSRRPPTQAITHTALARVFFLGTAEFLYREDERLFTWREGDILVRVDMVFEIQDGGAVTSAESVREAAVYRSTEFGESSEALEAVCEALSTVPLLRFPDRWQDEEEAVTITGPGGVEVYVELERSSSWRAWTLTAVVGDDPAEFAELTCEPDEDMILDASGAGLGLTDYPFVLRVSGGPLPHGNPAWGLAAWVLSQLPV
ncbi:UNVERIFIED_ORG: hypothetical protein FHR35_009132 [Microbispora rosea subsp. rosea]